MNIARNFSALFRAGWSLCLPMNSNHGKRFAAGQTAKPHRRLCRFEPLERRELLTVDVAANVPVAFSNLNPADFNGDHASDILWHDQSNGRINTWTIRNGAFGGETFVGTADPAQWKVVGVGDFNGDGTSDILWQNQSNGTVGDFIMKNGVFSGWVSICTADPKQWKVAGVGDFNGDGTADILWHNQSDGTLGTFLMRDGAFNRWVQIGTADPTQWKVAGIGDFSGDGTADILWHNQSNGTLGTFVMSNGAFSSWVYMGATDPTQWKVAGIGDFNADGTADILWHNQSNGTVGTFLMKNGGYNGWVQIGAADPTQWSVAGIGNFNSDGTADILWRNGTGSLGTWFMSDSRFGGWAAIDTTTYTNIKTPGLAGLVQSLDADGSINRNDMIQILRATTSDDGTVNAVELADLRYILANSTYYAIPGYVQTLAGDIVNGNQANAHYRGQTLGNLAAGSTWAQMDKLINKWFFGADHPATTYAYNYFAGSLFSNGPAYNDSNQGYLGDCYFIASMDSIAQSSPAAIRNMFIDNGDNTWTVRYYRNGVADYVTVDRYLPTSSNYPIYAKVGGNYSYGGNELWMALAEKAYAQWNETGKEGRDGKNAYDSIEGGWMQTVCQQALGTPSQTYWGLLDSDKSYLVNGMNAQKAVTYATITSPDSHTGLVGNHAYMCLNYDAASDTFQLYNPWGSSQPVRLTYAQLRMNGDVFVVASTSGSVPISTVAGGTHSSAFTTTVVALQSAKSSTAVCDLAIDEVSANQATPHAVRSSTITRVRAVDLFGDRDDLYWIASSSARHAKNASNGFTQAADALFARHDAIYLGCL